MIYETGWSWGRSCHATLSNERPSVREQGLGDSKWALVAPIKPNIQTPAQIELSINQNQFDSQLFYLIKLR